MSFSTNFEKLKQNFSITRIRLIVFLSIFGPATITAMADNDASGVATYSVAGAVLGYPILFILPIVTILLAVTQEMGIRLSVVTGKGFGDLIRERFGVKVSLFIFLCLFIANTGTTIANLSAIKITSSMLRLPVTPFVLGAIIIAFFFVTKGNYKTNQKIFLFSSLFYLAYIISAFKANPDWNHALSNLIFPSGINFTKEYLKNYLIIGMGVLGTTITPWGQFFISSFVTDKKIDPAKLKYSQAETYFGAFLTDFFSFFMIVATAATLFIHNIPLNSGEQAAMAIKPFAGELASALFAIGILNAGFMGIIIIPLSTAYAFSEFFGIIGSLDNPLRKGKIFYGIFLIQLLIAAVVVTFPSISLFKFVIITQSINAIILPIIFYYLIRLTSSNNLMGKYTNTPFQKYFTAGASVIIVVASIFAIVVVTSNLFKW